MAGGKDEVLEPTTEEQEPGLAVRVKPSGASWQLPVAIASLLLGIAISLQFRTTSETPRSSNSGQRAELQVQLQKVEEERELLRTELNQTRERINEIEQALGKGESLHRELVAQVDAAKLQAGLVALKGPGLVVRLSDSPRQPGPNEDPYHFIVHDTDLFVLVNELWASGAEAVTVNDQRMVTRSSIRCVGPTVLVNTNRVASPFIVKAIGDVDHLEGGLKMPGGYLDSMSRLTNNGGEVVISRMREVQIGPYNGSLTYRFAAPVEEESNEVAGSEGDGGV